MNKGGFDQNADMLESAQALADKDSGINIGSYIGVYEGVYVDINIGIKNIKSARRSATSQGIFWKR